MPTLIIQNNSASNPLTLNLSNYMDLTTDSDIDPQDPAFSSKVISHSLLKQGGILALEDFQNKELLFPLMLNAPTATALAQLIIEIDQILTAPGATFSWQDDNMSQPTIFDGISGEFDIKYNYRETSSPAHWCKGDLKLFTMPFGHIAGPRAYAAASAVGPLLMISPYASSGALAIGASTQAGAAGFGGRPMGASSGIFYPGSPSLAGDAPAQLQMTFAAPAGLTTAIGLLPDHNYQPLTTAGELGHFGTSLITDAKGVASQYVSFAGPGVVNVFAVPPGGSSFCPPAAWNGFHRLFAIARASGGGIIGSVVTTLVANPTVASVPDLAGHWQMYDLGTFALHASQTPNDLLNISMTASSAGTAIDLTALICLPDNSTWFLQGAQSSGWVLDDTLGEQFTLTTTTAPSATGAAQQGQRITQYSRGLVPQPDPKNGLPIIAAVSVAAPQSFNQNLLTAQVSVLERTKYVLP